MENKKKAAPRRLSQGGNKEGEPKERQKHKRNRKKVQLKKFPKEERPETNIGKEKTHRAVQYLAQG